MAEAVNGVAAAMVVDDEEAAKGSTDGSTTAGEDTVQAASHGGDTVVPVAVEAADVGTVEAEAEEAQDPMKGLEGLSVEEQAAVLLERMRGQ